MIVAARSRNDLVTTSVRPILLENRSEYVRMRGFSGRASDLQAGVLYLGARMSHPDLDKILGFLLPFAQKTLRERGDFHPFGATVDGEEDLVLAMADVDEDSEEIDAQEMIDVLVEGFRVRARAGDLRASGICMDVRITMPETGESKDAICIRLEHEVGESLDVILPYAVDEDGVIDYDEMFSMEGEQQVFDPPRSEPE